MKISKDFIYITVIALLIALCGQIYFSYRVLPLRANRIGVYYNQDIQANRKIIETIEQANKFVYFAIYTFTRNDIKDALLGAKHRGLTVRGITDRDQLEKIDVQTKIIKELRDANIPVAVQDHAGIMHLKAVVTDKGYASGSYNWTGSATTLNDEILEVGTDESVRAQYERALVKILDKYSARP